MKIKNDFVTNSSSTSFIVDEDMTTSEVALEMIRVFCQDEGRLFNQLENISWLQENLKTFDENILIPYTTNYETWIFKREGKIYVQTCNNHPWELLKFNRKWPGEEDVYDLFYDLEFLDIDTKQVCTYEDHQRLLYKRIGLDYDEIQRKYEEYEDKK